jgi:hypothetical protein
MATHNGAALGAAEDARGGHPSIDQRERAAGQPAAAVAGGAPSPSRRNRTSAQRRLERVLLHPIDYLRRRITRGLQVDATDRPVRRGEQLHARVMIARPKRLGDVEVGLVCTELFASAVSDSKGGRRRGTASATAHEAWLPVVSTPGVHSVRLAVPAHAPFSYEGELVSFTWAVVARGRRKRRLDAQARHEIAVLP